MKYGIHARAVRHLREVLARDPASAVARLLLGKVLENAPGNPEACALAEEIGLERATRS